MGQLEASCFAQGSDNTLYALAYGYDLSVPSGDSAVAVLLKSNASPSGPNALTWQVISTIRKSELFSFEKGEMIQCIADPNGAFLAWAYRTNRQGQGATAQSRPGGIRYDPSLSTPSTTTTGKGGWVNVDTPLSYSWTSTSAGGDLFYLKDGSGKYNFFHAFIPGSVSVSIKFGSLNTATTPNTMENSATTWSVALGNYTTPVTCSNPGAMDAKVYKYCPVSFKLFIWDGNKNLDPIGMSQLPVKDIYTFATTAIFGDSSTSYMLVQSGGLSPDDAQSGGPGFGSYVLKAVALTGAAAGSVLNVPNNITVQDNIAFFGRSEGGAGGGAKWGTAAVGFILLFLVLALCARRRKKTDTIIETQPVVMTVHTATTTYITRA
ncbi:hypothetical protein MVEG_07144 [Podila verticillata NRRL 6337]|nr:hypothetical protein MVEG_07144 [Podila verticillata NRRL 6337]